MNKKRLLISTAVFLMGAVPLSGLGWYIYKHTDELTCSGTQTREDADRVIAEISEQTGVSPSPDIEIMENSPSEEAVSGISIETETDQPLALSGIEVIESPSESESDSAAESITESITDSAEEDAPQTGAAVYAGASDTPIPQNHQVIFVGDSRTVGMGRAEKHLNDNCIYIGESGEGYNWFLEYGMDMLSDAIKEYPDLPVIFNLGVNDCDAIASYIEVYHVLEKEYPDTQFWYMSVNPVTEESPHVPNSDVLAFNEELSAAFRNHYIDCCSWMMEEGFEDVDSVHYSEEQYCKIHDFAVRTLIAAEPG